MDIQFSEAPLTLQERIWLARAVRQGDDEALLELLCARIVSPITRRELLWLPGPHLDALVQRLVQSLDEIATGRTLIRRYGLQ